MDDKTTQSQKREVDASTILRTQCMLSVKLVKDGLDHMEDILRVTKMAHTPEYTKSLLNMEAEAVTKAYKMMLELKTKYKAQPEACECTIMFMDVICEDYEAILEEYQAFQRHGSTGGF